ncbi:helix-turn-helix domain-containing protein [Candidatus Fukatsuia symbiotica]|uniref:Transcriptional regulator n=1 Tax=Candidatus Fukatsuia symbiotica TaxID=1878942 RepID=A0A2U8I575_9GAMM|nr:helix-turn-helix domain-containing protein [Candidatus Fukatsuia symbiotica]AWK14311.1 transcriptional regulator [Candidatus Fukatsuia symbiotica]MEA9444568.1 helix-turn-helix domain-containing protein [Candidatus Fukatsuia symbiotica]
MKTQYDQELLNNGHKKYIVEPELWSIEIGDAPCTVTMQWENENTEMTFDPGWKGFMAVKRSSLEVVSGCLPYQPMDIEIMAKLQAFIDKSMNDKVEKTSPQHYFATIKMDDDLLLTSRRDIEYWLLRQTLNPTAGMEKFIALLRNTEWYWLVYFLLDEFNGSSKLQDLGQRYGLSASHFRRLSRRALGNTTKVTLRDWRMGKAVLALIDEEQNLTDIAFEHGYSSLSHFSNQVKETLGVSPRGLRHLITSPTQLN